MKNIFLPFLLPPLALLLANCGSSPVYDPLEEGPAPAVVPAVSDTLPPSLMQQRTLWMEAFNEADPDKTAACYWEQAGALSLGRFRQGSPEILRLLADLRSSMGPVKSYRAASVVRHDDNHYFEMGQLGFGGRPAQTYAYVTAWKIVDGRWLRELEVLEPVIVEEAPSLKQIDQARRLWQQRSNAHEHQALVSQSYTAEGYYFNQGGLHQGTEAISQVYSYMSQPNWQITLTPLAVMPVQDGLAFELGQYLSGGIGHYFIAWQKQQAGHWQVLLDFNF